MAKATAAASRAMTVAVEMVLPGVLGFWIDKQLGTWILFTILGFVFGLTLAIWHLLKMTKAVAANNSQESKSETDSSRAGREDTTS
jgi:F0F1-type ATP synthase assembly protein I